MTFHCIQTKIQIPYSGPFLPVSSHLPRQPASLRFSHQVYPLTGRLPKSSHSWLPLIIQASAEAPPQFSPNYLVQNLITLFIPSFCFTQNINMLFSCLPVHSLSFHQNNCKFNLSVSFWFLLKPLSLAQSLACGKYLILAE